MPKKETAPHSNPPERPAPKTMTIDLTLDVATKLRKLSTRTGLTQAYLRGELTRSREVEAAIIKALYQIYLDWKEDLADDLFGPPTETREVRVSGLDADGGTVHDSGWGKG